MDVEIPKEITGDLKRRRAPWWAAIITTVVMSIGGASGAIINYLDNRDARRLALREAQAEGAVNAIWVQKQADTYEAEIADLKARLSVQQAVIDGYAARLSLLERQAGRGVVRASRRLQVPLPDEAVVRAEEMEKLAEKRPERPSRANPLVQYLLKGLE